MFQYRTVTEKELRRLWNRSILEHPFDRRYRAWKRVFLQLNRDGMGATFAVLHNGTPVGEGTQLFSPQADAVRGREWLADGVHTANINALRIRKPYEGQGHISALIKEMERYAASTRCAAAPFTGTGAIRRFWQKRTRTGKRSYTMGRRCVYEFRHESCLDIEQHPQDRKLTHNT